MMLQCAAAEEQEVQSTSKHSLQSIAGWPAKSIFKMHLLNAGKAIGIRTLFLGFSGWLVLGVSSWWELTAR